MMKGHIMQLTALGTRMTTKVCGPIIGTSNSRQFERCIISGIRNYKSHRLSLQDVDWS
jgi:hypothetical protein